MHIENFELNKLQYIIDYPQSFTSEKKYPVIIFLHGAGSRGNNIEKLNTNPYFIEKEKHTDLPFLTVAPLCSKNTWFDLWEHLKELVIKILNMPFVDANRIYLMGVSMGGYATWQLAMSMPQYFAAIVPICGGGMYWNAGRLVNVPVWAFHGAKDTTVLPEESVKMVDAVNRRGGNAKLTIYPENAHNAWSDTFSNLEVFKWMLSNTNSNAQKLLDEYKSADIYG